MNNETLKTNTLTYSSTIRKLISTWPLRALSRKYSNQSVNPASLQGEVYISPKDLELTKSILKRFIAVEAELDAQRLPFGKHVGNRKSKIVNSHA